jgi:exodeoxyribonuclease VII small subunit
MGEKNTGEMTFEESLARLEKIIGRLEKGDVPLGDSLLLFEEGINLIRDCSQKLDAAEARIAKLVTTDVGEAKIVPFDVEGESKGV